MILLSDISEPQAFNQNIVQAFESMSDKLYLLNPLFGHYLRTKQYPALRACVNEIPINYFPVLRVSAGIVVVLYIYCRQILLNLIFLFYIRLRAAPDALY